MTYEIHTSELEDETPIGRIWLIRAVEHFELGKNEPPAGLSPIGALLLGTARSTLMNCKYTRVLATDQTGQPTVFTLPGHWPLDDFGELVRPTVAEQDEARELKTEQFRAAYSAGTSQALPPHLEVALDKLAAASPHGQTGSAALAVADLLDWLMHNTEARSATVRATFRVIAETLASHGYLVPELKDLPPVRPPAAKVRKRSGKRKGRTTAQRNHTREIREWARSQGMYVEDHGRLPASVHTAYANRPGQ